ncbi:hypothetical protein BGZ89_010960 [Linnemannia elongata]|nr:hypothetical protein BGZ89_010960 [Linnemannia elongata]
MMSPNNTTEDSSSVQPMQHIPLPHLIPADRPIYHVPLSHNDEGNPYVSMKDVYVTLQYPGDILIFKDEYQQSPVLIQSAADRNQGWIPFYPNRTLYFLRPNQEVATNSPPLLPPPPPTRTRRSSTRVRSSRRGSPPPLPLRIGSATPSPPRSGFYDIGLSRTKSPRASPTRSSNNGAITSSVTSPSPHSTGSCTPYDRRSFSTGPLFSTRHAASSNQEQQSHQHAVQTQPNEVASPPAASPLAATTAAATGTGSHDSATSGSADSSSHGGSPGPSAPVTGQPQGEWQRDSGLRGMISNYEELSDESRTRDLQRNGTVNQVLTEIAYLNQCNQNLQRDNQELQRQLHALQHENQALRQDNQAFYQDVYSFRQANQNLAQENHNLRRESQTIHQNYHNLNQVRKQEICDLQNQNVHLRHHEGYFVCVTCKQRQQGGLCAASPSSSSSSRSANPHGPSTLRRLAPAPPQNPRALPPSTKASQSQIEGFLGHHQRGHPAVHQYDGVGSPSGAPYVESLILGTSPTLPPQSSDTFNEDDPTGTAAAALVMVSQGQGRVPSEHDSSTAQRSSSSQSLSPAATRVAECVERDNMDPYNSGIRENRVRGWVREIDEGGYIPHAEYEDEEDAEQREDEEAEEREDYELEEGELEEGDIEEGDVEEGEDEQ